MSYLVNFAAIPLDMDTCKTGGFFNQQGGNFNSKCCDVLNAEKSFSQIPTVQSCPQTRDSCIFMEGQEQIWEQNKDLCCR